MIGPRFQERLARLGMKTVPDVLQYDVQTLSQWLGERAARWLYDRVRGIDHGEVEGHGEAKSISRDETFPADIHDDDELMRELLALVTRAATDLRSDALTARTITVKLRDFDFKTRQASRTLPKPVISDRVILEVARSLLAKLRKARRVPARLIGVGLSSLDVDVTTDQLTLFEMSDSRTDETDRDRLLARTVDRVRAKFGAKGILPARLID
jgi:DNA polymerase-4